MDTMQVLFTLAGGVALALAYWHGRRSGEHAVLSALQGAEDRGEIVVLLRRDVAKRCGIAKE